MKKSLIALAVLAASGAAMAQSTVTLYGVVDAYVSSTKTTSVAGTNPPGFTTSKLTQNGVNSGGQNGSRWGIRVKEDLGGGLAAVATIEAGLNADTGTNAQGGLPYGRQVFGGLSGGFGTLTLGRQYSAYDDIHGTTSVQGNNAFDVSLGNFFNLRAADFGVAGPTAATVNAATAGVGAWVSYDNARVNNSIKYQSNSYGGFSGALVYGFGENKTAATAATHDTSFNLKYANGPITGAVAYQENQFSPTFKLKNTLVGGAYDFGAAKLFANYNRAKFTNVAKQNEYSLGVAVPVGALTLVGQYAQSNGDDIGKSKGFGLEAWYDLSKRTRAYTSYANTKKEALNNERNTVFAVGLRHSF